MYLHLGSGVVVRARGLVGIFDIERTTSTRTTRNYLAACEKKKEIVTVGDDFPKSFAVFEEDGKKNTYISQISAATLKKRVISGHNKAIDSTGR